MICRKTMEPCRTPGMCAPYSGCQPSILKEVSVRYSSESGAQVVENTAVIPGLCQFIDYVWALRAERDELRAQVEAMRAALEVVAEWRLPETGHHWASGEPMSYGACYGSNGERDFMRHLATEALQADK